MMLLISGSRALPAAAPTSGNCSCSGGGADAENTNVLGGGNGAGAGEALRDGLELGRVRVHDSRQLHGDDHRLPLMVVVRPLLLDDHVRARLRAAGAC